MRRLPLPLLALPLLAAGGRETARAREPEGEATRPVWVFFDGKGPSASGRAALAEAEARLSDRALDRRARAGTGPVVDERDVALPAERIAAVRATGARVRHESRWLAAVSVDATPGQEAALARLGFVRGVRPVARRWRALGPPPPPPLRGAPAVASDAWPPVESDYGLSWFQAALVTVPALHGCGLDGEGVVVGVQDTGFDRSHLALAGAEVLAERDFLAGDDVTWDETDDEYAVGQDSHGTQVLSLIAAWDPGRMIGVAPRASFLLSKTEDVAVEVPAEEDHWVAGIEWQEQMGADLVTSSLGYIDWYTAEDLDGATAVTTVAAAIAAGKGLIVLNAAGNAGPAPSTLIAPADAEEVLAVGAVDPFGYLSSFSSRGPTADGRVKPDVVAPGQGVLVVSPGSGSEYHSGNGTSFATPIAAGVVALLKQAWPDWGPAEVRSALVSTASLADAPDPGMGWGLIDGLAAAGLYCSCTDADRDGRYDLACGGDDCDDGSAAVHPGAEEVCDGRDDDCDGVLGPGEADGDGDGRAPCTGLECDDADPATHGGAQEVPYDGVDQDCDGRDADDLDGDGFAGGEGGADCDDGDPEVHPARPEDCGDGVDQDCDGAADGIDAQDCPGPAGPVGGPEDCGGCGSAPGAPTGAWGLIPAAAALGRRRNLQSMRPTRSMTGSSSAKVSRRCRSRTTRPT